MKGLLLNDGNDPNKLPFPGLGYDKIYYLVSSFFNGSGLMGSYLTGSFKLNDNNTGFILFWFKFGFFFFKWFWRGFSFEIIIDDMC